MSDRQKPPPKALRDVWAKVPRMIGCDGRCWRSCGPVPITPTERRVVERVAGKPIDVDKELTCSLLVNGRCCAYTARPLLCRLWGATEGMPCTFGCKPERVLTDDEARALMSELVMLEHGVEAVLEPSEIPDDMAERVDDERKASAGEQERRGQQDS